YRIRLDGREIVKLQWATATYIDVAPAHHEIRFDPQIPIDDFLYQPPVALDAEAGQQYFVRLMRFWGPLSNPLTRYPMPALVPASVGSAQSSTMGYIAAR